MTETGAERDEEKAVFIDKFFANFGAAYHRLRQRPDTGYVAGNRYTRSKCVAGSGGTYGRSREYVTVGNARSADTTTDTAANTAADTERRCNAGRSSAYRNRHGSSDRRWHVAACKPGSIGGSESNTGSFWEQNTDQGRRKADKYAGTDQRSSKRYANT